MARIFVQYKDRTPLMRNLLVPILLIVFFSCQSPAPNPLEEDLAPADSPLVHTQTDAHTGYDPEDDEPVVPLVRAKASIRLPQGIYEGQVATPKQRKQTIQFFTDHRFLMQEEYTADSIVTTTGTWAPSNGAIYVYKNNLVWGHYQWKESNLQYLDPASNKGYALTRRESILDNAVWQQKKAAQVSLFAIGNEPFWSVEQLPGDSIRLLWAGTGVPLTLVQTQTTATSDSTVLVARSDSADVRLVVLNHFCTDGMSEAIYPNKVKLHYNGQVYQGCGVKYQ